MLKDKIEILECKVDKIEGDYASIIILYSSREIEKKQISLRALEEHGIAREGLHFQIEVEQKISIIDFLSVGDHLKKSIKEANIDSNIFKI